ncbi:SusD/RagB family nutrient-binding outer membrane lipoprotein [Parabacteroides sp. FAFU027]|uniref:SusD/RagB family nutrient-binding outer membrane lipoprotein n=1 Tax=Parabacteroides sp. FAFU027 TaxID=2922715 RepID=UPI001FAFBAB7|nr:SusD/RagB family nutrient-binding outer membrane lipoprotein [Parabacteroides sp. FAFU027]
MNKIIYKYLLVLISTFSLLGCSDKFWDINTDPNNPSVVTPALALPSGISGSVFVIGGYYHALGSFWTQQYAQAPAASQWLEWESYNLTDDDFDRQFTTMYSGALTDLQYVREQAKNSSSWPYYSIATLVQAYDFQVLADLYDQIPFTEALKGSTILQPKYDKGALVYDSLFARIDDAISRNLTNVPASLETSDVLLGGDMDAWIAFGNTLKLKMYLRYVNVDPNKYKSQIIALLNENNFLTKDVRFTAFKAQETGYNPFYNTFVDRLAGNIVANKTLVNYLENNNDPRLQKFFNASVTGSIYASVATGESKTLLGTINNYATPNIGQIDPVYLFTKEEVLFMIAEAQARYKTSAEAQATYLKGIKASLSRYGLPEDTVSYSYNGIKSIIEQKWIAATNLRAIEAYFDFNRTGYPDFFSTSLTSVLSGNARPKRLFFPATERKTNANTPDRVPLTEKVWWGL